MMEVLVTKTPISAKDMKVRKFRPEDIELMQEWLQHPHVHQYFGNPEEWLEEITENIDAEWVKYFIAETGKPIGFLQYYETDKAPEGEWSAEPAGTVGIDYLIADKENLGKGYGSEIIRLLIELIKTTGKYKYIIADPVPQNQASARVLEKNGFAIKENGFYFLNLAE
ncbi:MAG: acetyltransferase [Lentimicrobium sp.]|nr:acetyltransferase [Lentimicrobium sp.]